MTRACFCFLWCFPLLVVAATNARAGDIGKPVTVGNWFEAVEICGLKFDGRLCRADEWMAACRGGRIKVWEPEWVGDVSRPLSGRTSSGFESLSMMPGCEGGRWDDPRAMYAIRCCFDHK